MMFINIYDNDINLATSINLIAKNVGVAVLVTDPQSKRNSRDGALDPSTRAKYLVTNHIPPEELIWELSRKLSPPSKVLSDSSADYRVQLQDPTFTALPS